MNIEIPFSHWSNRFPTSPCWIVGRGVTRFSYIELLQISDPIIFINDAVDCEKFVEHAHTFFFATDREVVREWAPLARSVYVHRCWDKVDFSVCRRFTKTVHVNHPTERLLEQTREQLASSRTLYQSGGSIHPAIHFAWYLGCRGIYFVGCDGMNMGYDPRIIQRHKNKPGNVFGDIRKKQDEIAGKLGLVTTYIGTPLCPTSPQSASLSDAPKSSESPSPS